MGNPIASTDDITDCKLLIADAEIEKLVPEMWDLCRNLGIEPRRRPISRNGASRRGGPKTHAFH